MQVKVKTHIALRSGSYENLMNTYMSMNEAAAAKKQLIGDIGNAMSNGENLTLVGDKGDTLQLFIDEIAAVKVTLREVKNKEEDD